MARCSVDWPSSFTTATSGYGVVGFGLCPGSPFRPPWAHATSSCTHSCDVSMTISSDNSTSQVRQGAPERSGVEHCQP
eukprot:2127510-Prymnesium_polylepis.1